MARLAQNRWYVFVGFFVTGLLLLPHHLAQCAADPSTQQTLQGEIVDPAAYVKEGRRGAEQTEQTYEAVDGGQTLALLEDGGGALYLLLADSSGSDPNEAVYDYVNQRVKLTGRVYERAGLHGIVVTSVEPLEASSAPQPSSSTSPKARN